MRRDRTKPGSGEAPRPAYDNPAGDKGELAAGNNAENAENRPGPQPTEARRAARPAPDKTPHGHASDKKLGQQPRRGD